MDQGGTGHGRRPRPGGAPLSRTEVLTFTPEWLTLRESADAEARATAPLSLLYGHGRVVADLGCGTGSMGRWLSPLLPERSEERRVGKECGRWGSRDTVKKRQRCARRR